MGKGCQLQGLVGVDFLPQGFTIVFVLISECLLVGSYVYLYGM